MYKLVIFDLDGTLLDTIEDLANACNYALKQCGLDIYEVNRYKRFVGDGRIKLIERIIPESIKSEELFNKVLALYDEYYLEHMVDMTKPYSGICDLLEYLKSKGIKLAVVSNKPHEFAYEIVKKYFEDIFDEAYGHRLEFKVKPDPAALIDIMERNNIDKKDCIYIGDSNVDIVTAKNAGVESVGVSWGFRGREELEEAGATFVVDTINDLKNILDSE